MKHATKLSHAKSTSAWAILFDGKNAGRIVANWSDNPCGSVCTLSMNLWEGPLCPHDVDHGSFNHTARAGGYGYCKFSAAFSEMLRKAGVEHPNISGVGREAVERFMESQGYRVIQVLY